MENESKNQLKIKITPRALTLGGQQLRGAVQAVGEDVPVDIALISDLANLGLATAGNEYALRIVEFPDLPVLHDIISFQIRGISA